MALIERGSTRKPPGYASWLSSSRRPRSWAKRFGPSCLSQSPSISRTASRMVYADQFAAASEGDTLGTSVMRICSALEVAETLELAEQVVDCLLADASPRGKLGGSCSLGPRVQQDVQVGRVQVVESALVQPLEHPPLHLFPGHPQEGADQRWPEDLLRVLSKVT